MDENRKTFALRAWFIGGLTVGLLAVLIVRRLLTGEWDIGELLGGGFFILGMSVLWWWFTVSERRKQNG